MYDPEFDSYLTPKRTATPAKKRPGRMTPPVVGNPWRTIWPAPKGTIRAILRSGRDGETHFLEMIMGINALLGRAFRSTPGGLASLPSVLLVAVVGSIVGVLASFLMGYLIRWTGGWLGGRATAAECRAALAWGAVPLTVNVAIVIALIFAGVHPGASPAAGSASAAFLLTAPIRAMTILWSGVLIVLTVAEVHRISSWASLAAIFLASVLFVGVGGVIVAIAFGFNASLDGPDP